MAAFESTPAATALVRRPRDLDVPILVAGCWAILVVAELTGASAALHHHALIEGGVPLTAAVPIFLVGWLVMAAAMMLPASLRAIQLVEGAASAVAFAATSTLFVPRLVRPGVDCASGWRRSWATSASTMSSTPRPGSRSDRG